MRMSLRPGARRRARSSSSAAPSKSVGPSDCLPMKLRLRDGGASGHSRTDRPDSRVPIGGARFCVGSVGAPQPATARQTEHERDRTRRMKALLAVDYAATRAPLSSRRECGTKDHAHRPPRALASSCVVLLVGRVHRATVIGTPCLVDKDCNVNGQRCVAGLNGGAKICTHACTGQTGAQGCPIGYDCTASDPAQPTVLTCNKEPYAFDATTRQRRCSSARTARSQGGTTQAEWDVACAGTGDPAPSPTCRHAADPDSRTTPRAPLRNDAHAYCTGSCTSDADCPVDMRCGADYDGDQVPAPRLLRSVRDERQLHRRQRRLRPDQRRQLALLLQVVRLASTTAAACRGASSPARPPAIRSATSGMFCLHKFGACVGTGEVCDPCRSESDCANGTHCFGNLATGERMCTKACTMDSRVRVEQADRLRLRAAAGQCRRSESSPMSAPAIRIITTRASSPASSNALRLQPSAGDSSAFLCPQSLTV